MSPPYAPYGDRAADTIYNLLFCDAIEDFAKLAPHFPPIFAEHFDEADVRAIAGDGDVESRVRMIAYQRLLREGADVPKGVVLGVIVEVAMEDGLDTLAGYGDGRVRYINQAGGMTILEERVSVLSDKALALVEAAKPLVARIGPWDEARRPPPEGSLARLSFLVSDGLYFGEAPLQALARDPISRPVINAAIALLTATVDLSLAGDGGAAGR